MSRHLVTPLFLSLVFAMPAAVVQSQSPPRGHREAPNRTADPTRSAERWVRQLESELDHLQEDLLYERGNYPAGLAEQVELTSRAAAHFRQLLRRDTDPQHLLRDFREMDQHVHRLVNTLNQTGDLWMRRQASRIQYPDEQLHYVLNRLPTDPQTNVRDLLARHSHLLENEAANFQRLVERVVRRNDPFRQAVQEYAAEAEHFHEAVERATDIDHLQNDFGNLEEAWRRVVDRVNQSPYGLYLRRNAQNLNRVHNQIHGLLTAGPGPHHPQPRQNVQPRRSRPAIEVEIPGIGRVRIPR